MNTTDYFRSLEDINVNSSDIPPTHKVETLEEAFQLGNKLLRGEYISLPNKNDLSEVLIYRRTSFKPVDLSVFVWDGKSIDTSWFKAENAGIYYIENASQLAGLQEILENGYNFKGQTIELTSNINLGGRDWTPLGSDYVEDVIDQGDLFSKYFRIHLAKESTFSGTLEGNNHTIYGLHLNASPNMFNGLFRAVNGATIKNLTLEVNDLYHDYGKSPFAALFGYARDSKFINVCAGGFVTGQRCSGLGGTAINCSFIQCMNGIDFEIHAQESVSKLIVGGFLQYVGLSSTIIEEIHGEKPIVFNNCLQAGKIIIDADNASAVICGQLYAATLYRKDGAPYGLSINHCNISERGVAEITNFDSSRTSGVFYARVNNSDEPKNVVTNVNIKIDLLGGLLGKTDAGVGMDIVRVTQSTKVNAMIIPGSVNTLSTRSGSGSFITQDVSSVMPEDSIMNLQPYYTFIKTSKI